MLVNKICEHLSQRIESGQLSNEDIVQIIEYCGAYLNLRTISDYAKENNLSYNGTKKFRKNIELFGVKFIVDNE
jgi:hypothetical protein